MTTLRLLRARPVLRAVPRTRPVIIGSSQAAAPAVIAAAAANRLPPSAPSPVTGSSYLLAPGVEPVRIRVLHHHLHRRASHTTKPPPVPDVTFTYTDFLHLTPASDAGFVLADLSATLDPAVSLVEQQHA